jgi:hypothetical protein
VLVTFQSPGDNFGAAEFPAALGTLADRERPRHSA